MVLSHQLSFFEHLRFLKVFLSFVKAFQVVPILFLRRFSLSTEAPRSSWSMLVEKKMTADGSMAISQDSGFPLNMIGFP